MALKLTSHALDTCGCVVVYAWDDQLPEDQRVHTPIEHARSKRCSVHAGEVTPAAHMDATMKENRRKNSAVNTAADVLQVDPTTIGYAMTAARDVVVVLPRGTPQNKKAAVESELGKSAEHRGRVSVEVRA